MKNSTYTDFLTVSRFFLSSGAVAVIDVLLAVFLSVIFLDPANAIFNAKEILYTLVLAVSFMIKPYIDGDDAKALRLFFFLVLGMLPIGILIGLTEHMDKDYLLLLVKAFAFSPIVMVANRHRENFYRAFIVASLALILVSIGAFFASLIGLDPMVELFLDSGNMFYGPRGYGPIMITMVFMKTSPLLVFSLGAALVGWNRSKRLSWLLLAAGAFFTLLISGTRANAFSACAIIALWTFSRLPKVTRAVIAVMVSVAVIPDLVSWIAATFFAADEVSLGVKLGHVDSYLNLFSREPLILLFGQGIGQELFSTGYSESVFVTELTYFELVRTWGIPLTIVCLALAFGPLFRRHVDLTTRFAGISYAVIAGTNPLFLSSTGFIALALIWLLSERDRQLWWQSKQTKAEGAGVLAKLYLLYNKTIRLKS